MKEFTSLASQLAPAYNAFLKSNPPDDATPMTTERTQRLLDDAVAAKISDIHLDPHKETYRVRFRLDGALYDVAELTKEAGVRMLRYLRTKAKLETPKPYESQEGRLHFDISGQPWEIRFAMVPAIFGEKASLRLFSLHQLEKKISELGMSEDTLKTIRDWASDSTGMMVVAGPTGSGKTTTLYALLHDLKSRQRSIVTIEDPIEYPIEGVTQLEVHPDKGLTFGEGLKTILRLDPDYLLVGEIRDRESALTAIDAASAGRILMSTLHSRDAVSAITTLRNYGVADHEIATALEMVVAQRLVRKLCGKCRELSPPTDPEKRWMERLEMEAPSHCWHANGCDACIDTGFRGRIGVFEVWRLGKPDKQQIMEHAAESLLNDILLSQNHTILLQDGLAKAATGQTTLAELQAMGARVHPEHLSYPRTLKT